MNHFPVLKAVIINLFLFLGLGLVSCTFEKREEIIPMEFLVVTEENAADRLAEEPNEEVESEPEPEPPKPEPEPEPDPLPPPPPPPPDPDPVPLPDPPKPKPKPPEKPKPVEKPKPKPPEPKWKPAPVTSIKRGQRVGPVTTGKKDPKKAATQKALSAAEIQKLLAAGAKSGNRNQVPPNDASRCYGVIERHFKDACTQYGLESSPTGKAPVLTVTFGSGGSIRSIRIRESSGDRAWDNQVLQACRQVRRVSGLSSAFLAEYKSVDLRLNVE